MIRYNLSRRIINRRLSYSLRSLATNNIEYDIDYISLRKTPRPPLPQVQVKGFRLQPQFIDKVRINETLNNVHKTENDMSNFVERYYRELTTFLQFIRKSYNHKINSFGELTSIELLNSLYIFKDSYFKGKIPEVAAYNYISYNYMFDRFLNLLHSHKDFPQQLAVSFLIESQGVELLSMNWGNYIHELLILDKDVNFKRLNHISDLVAEINVIINDLNKFLAKNNNLNFNDEFFKIFIQIQRHKNLKKLLAYDTFKELKPKDLRHLLRSTEFTSLSQSIIPSLKVHLLNMELMAVLIPDIRKLTYVEILQKLYHLKSKGNCAAISKQLTQISNVIINAACNGQIKYNDKPQIDPFTVFVISSDVIENLEFSMIFKYKLYRYVDELKLAKAMDISFTDLSTKGLKFENDVLQTNFDNLKIALSDFFKVIPWQTKSLDNLITYKNWMDWCYENESKPLGGSVDYSNLANYLYTEVKLTTEFAHLLSVLNDISSKNNHINLSCVSTKYLVSLLLLDNQQWDEFIKLDKINDNIYLSNLQTLLNEFNQLHGHLKSFDLSTIRRRVGKDFRFFNRAEISQYFGYYGDLISDPLILDNLLIIYENNGDKDSSRKELESYKQRLKDYAKELTILRTDELTYGFNFYGETELYRLLAHRVDEVLSNLNPKPESRLSYDITKYHNLLKVLEKFYQLEGSNEYLEEIIQDYIMSLWSPGDLLELKQFKDSVGSLNGLEWLQIKELWENYVTERLEAKSNVDEMKREFDRLSEVLYVTPDLDSCIDDQYEIHNGFRKKHEEAIIGNFDYTYTSSTSVDDISSVPEELGLKEFVNELKYLRNVVLFKDKFADYKPAPLMVILLDIVTSLSTGVMPLLDINRSTADKYTVLILKLYKLFESTSQTAILDDFIDCSRIDSSYKQIPDDFHIEQFIEELRLVKNELQSDFKAFEAKDIITTIQWMLTKEFTDEQKDNLDKLLSNLVVLFKYQGDNTEILDIVVNSSSVFERFESKNGKSSDKTYKQVPDNFQLEEYYNELNQLKLKLGNKFCNANSEQILLTLKDMSNDKKIFNLAKRTNFTKLYGNLVSLFKHNGGETFILDNVLINREMFDEFESNKPKRVNNEFSKVLEYSEYIDTFFDRTEFNNFELIDYYELTLDEFNHKCNEFLEWSKQQDSYSDRCKEFIMELQGLVKNDIMNLAILSQVRSKASDIDVVKADIRTFMTRVLENKNLYNDVRENTDIPNTKFDIADFKDVKIDLLAEAPVNNKGKYLTLTIDGQKIITNTNPLGNIEPQEMISVLNKFPKADRNKFIKEINQLTKYDWKVIAGSIDDELLVFTKEKLERSYFDKVKSLFALAGATFVLMIGVNWYLDDIDVSESKNNQYVPDNVEDNKEVKEIDSETLNKDNTAIANSSQQEQDPHQELDQTVKAGWFWK